MAKNKRNCILYRKNEKIVLQYLINCANKAKKFLLMSKENARKSQGKPKKRQGNHKQNQRKRKTITSKTKEKARKPQAKPKKRQGNNKQSP